jgi:hypothetical protein
MADQPIDTPEGVIIETTPPPAPKRRRRKVTATMEQRAAIHQLVELAFGASSPSDPYGTMMGPGVPLVPSPFMPDPEDQFAEIGATGLRTFAGFIHEAYNTELTWPNVFTLYNRLWRSDPEMTMVREGFTAMARRCSLEWELPDYATDGDRAAQEFGYECLDDMEGGPTRLIETVASMTPFFGWSWFEALPGLRSPNWTPPDEADTWRSQFDDGRIGIRRLALRHPSSFWRWDMFESRILKGLQQRVPPGYPPPLFRTIPLDLSLHLTFGDTVNPEGLTPLEAVWRIERMMYGYQVIAGIGFEHSAGYLNVTKTQPGTFGANALNQVKAAAKGVMTAQEGNYAAWPYGVEGEVKDIPFAAAGELTNMIKYLGIVKLQLYNMGWAAMSTTSSHGSLASVTDASTIYMLTFNAMMEGFADQMDAQIGKRLFEWNLGAFPGLTLRPYQKRTVSRPGAPTQPAKRNLTGMSQRPRLTITKVDKELDWAKFGALLTSLQSVMPFGDDDIKSIRKLTGFLPENLPPVEDEPTVVKPDMNTDTTEEDPTQTTPPDAGGKPKTEAVHGFIRRTFDMLSRKKV